MRAIPATPQMVEVARRIVWFEEPSKALADPVRFMAYAMTYARHEDMRVIRQYVSDDELRQAIDGAPPGIIDPRSWAYWNLRIGRFPPPPMRRRNFDNRLAVRVGAEARRRVAVQKWLEIRDQGTCVSAEEARRQAVDQWREQYGPRRKT